MVGLPPYLRGIGDICLHGWIPANPVDPMWSISVEEQFYIAIPLIAYFGRRLGLKVVSSMLLIVSYAMVIWYAWKGWHGFSSQWTNSFVQFQFFSAGTLLSLMLKGRTPKWNPVFRILGILGVSSAYLSRRCIVAYRRIHRAPRSYKHPWDGLLCLPEQYCFFLVCSGHQLAICQSRPSILAAFPMGSTSSINLFIPSSSTEGKRSLTASARLFTCPDGAEP